MELREFTEFADGGLSFPYKGRVYTPPEVGIDLGMRLNGIANGSTGEAAEEMDGIELFKLVLGPAWDEMVADGVPLAFATRAGATAIADFLYGRVYAEAMWETGADPKAMVAFMKAKGNRATRRSKSTGGATVTPSPASTKATTSRKR